MSDEDLRVRLEGLEARIRLNSATDDAIELAQRDRWPLDQTVRSLLPLLASHTGAELVWLRTYDENLELRDFTYGGAPGTFAMDLDAVAKETAEGEGFQRTEGDHFVVAQPLDVAGELFGGAGIALRGMPDPTRIPLLRDLLHTWCEELDNYLASIALMRRKHQVLGALSQALREPIIDVGVSRALEVLSQHVAYDDLLLVFRHEDDRRGPSLHYKIVQNGALTHDSHAPDMEVDEFLRDHAAPLLEGSSRELLDRFGVEGGREEVLISGVRETQVLGRLVVTSKHGEFNTFDRDLLERFADTLRQRVVDFNREWKGLSRIFDPGVVRRLLVEEDYVERLLRPRTMEAAILFADISGFTRISEQVLVAPEKVGALIDRWGEKVVQIVWDTGGVFDKMVGDCVIAFWGPPFGDLDAQAACRAAADAARRIRDFTHTLSTGELVPDLKDCDPPPGVATGLNFTTVSVGIFGPDEDYTAFGSGMNNAARLQGVATKDEILCMDAFVTAYGDESAFSEARDAQVKNVAAPLKFRALSS